MKIHTYFLSRTWCAKFLGGFLLAGITGCSLTPVRPEQSTHERSNPQNIAAHTPFAKPSQGNTHEERLVRGILRKIERLDTAHHPRKRAYPQEPIAQLDIRNPSGAWRSTHPNCGSSFGQDAVNKPNLPGFESISAELRGMASWYGPKFHGKNTANGEVYDQYGLTAAHLSLPMNTWIEVQNLNNGLRVRVRINDRGPYKRRRILDLSRKAAEMLKMIGPGSIPVCIQVLKWPNNINWSEGLVPYQQYVVQVSAHRRLQTANETLIAVNKLHPTVAWQLEERPTGEHAVLSKPFKQSRRAEWTARRLRDAGFRPLVRRRRK